MIVYSKNSSQYIQVKSSETPASKDGVVIDGSPWTEAQLYDGAPIFNKHDDFRATLVVIVDKSKSGETTFYIAPPADLEALVRERALEFAKRPKRDNTPRSIKFRKELPRDVLTPWHSAWHLLGEVPQPPEYAAFPYGTDAQHIFKRTISLPVAASQIRAVPSLDAVMTRAPSGLNTTLKIA